MNGAVDLGRTIQTAQAALQAQPEDQLDLGLLLGGVGGRVDSIGGRAIVNHGDIFSAFVEGSKSIDSGDWQAVTGIKVKW